MTTATITATDHSLPISEFEEQMKTLLTREDMTLWDQGDLLNAQNLSAAELAKYAQRWQRKYSTLKRRMEIASQFPKKGGLRDSRHSFHVYSELARIPAEFEQERRDLLDARSEWTIESMRRGVNDWLLGRGLGGASVSAMGGNGKRVSRSGGFNLNDGSTMLKGKVTQKGDVSDATGQVFTLELDIEGPGEFSDAEVRFVVLGNQMVAKVVIRP
jgi:hypothetical protein